MSSAPPTPDLAAQQAFVNDGKAFEHAKACFEENMEQFRHLNEQMNKIPAFAVTLTGGFWYIAVVVQSYGHGIAADVEQLARFGIMIFAGICDFMLVLVASRIRNVMAEYMSSAQRFQGSWLSESEPRGLLGFKDYSMISMYCALILTGAVMSIAGAFLLFPPPTRCSTLLHAAIVIAAFALIFVISQRMPSWLKAKLRPAQPLPTTSTSITP